MRRRMTSRQTASFATSTGFEPLFISYSVHNYNYLYYIFALCVIINIIYWALRDWCYVISDHVPLWCFRSYATTYGRCIMCLEVAQRDVLETNLRQSRRIRTTNVACQLLERLGTRQRQARSAWFGLIFSFFFLIWFSRMCLGHQAHRRGVEGFNFHVFQGKHHSRREKVVF